MVAVASTDPFTTAVSVLQFTSRITLLLFNQQIFRDTDASAAVAGGEAHSIAGFSSAPEKARYWMSMGLSLPMTPTSCFSQPQAASACGTGSTSSRSR
jgi:hypothetical protein